MERPTRKPDVIIGSQPYWTVDGPDGRPCIYSVGGLGDYYISVFDSMMMDDEPAEVMEWYKTVAPANVLVYFN